MAERSNAPRTMKSRRRYIDFQFWPAVLAGLIAGAIMEGPVYMQKALGLNLKQNIFRTWGRMLGLHGGGGYFAGFLFHQFLAALIALVYAGGFALLGVGDNLWLWGSRRRYPLPDVGIMVSRTGAYAAAAVQVHPRSSGPAPRIRAATFGIPMDWSLPQWP